MTTSRGIHKTTTGGGSWSLVFAPPTGPTGMQPVLVAPDDPARVFGGSDSSGFYRSLDGGATWTRHDEGIAAIDFTGLELCRDVPSVIYAAARSVGYLKTTDGGETWHPVGTAQGLGEHSQGGLGVHPRDPDVMITSTSDASTSRIWRTQDGGDSFTATASGYGSSWFRFNPHVPDRVHAGIGDWQGGFLYSGNGGGSWSVPYWWYIYPRSYQFHPDFADVVFGLGNRYTGAPTSTLHVVWSNNGGGSWTGPSFGQGRFQDLAVDWNDPTTLYVAGAIASEGSRGIYQFTVGYGYGTVASVTRVPGTFNDGLTNTEVLRLLYDPADAELYAATSSGVFRSRDQAASWEPLPGLPRVPTSAMAVSPDGTRLLVGTRGGIWEHTDQQPPVASCVDVEVAAGPGCSATASIDAGSHDPDGEEVRLAQDPPGPYPLGTTEVALTVTDAGGLSAACTATVTVSDDTPPAVDCQVPETIVPPDAPIAFSAVAEDHCAAEAVVTGYDCWAINGAGRRIDRTGSCVVEMDGASVTIVDSGGVGDHIEWTVVATDEAGNATEALCGPVEVARPGRGRP